MAHVLFRRRALEAHAAGEELAGSPLKISPRWVRYVYPLLLAVLVSFFLVMALGSVGDDAQGRAFVVVEGTEEGAAENQSRAATARVAAVFPGHMRPLLEAGMPLRFVVEGYRDSARTLTLARVEEGVLSTERVEELLGLDLASSNNPGQLAVAYAELPAQGFEASGRTLEWHHGLRGTARVRLGERRLLPMLLPGLRPLFGEDER